MELFIDLTACCEPSGCERLEEHIASLEEVFSVEAKEEKPQVLNLQATADPFLEEDGAFERLAEATVLLYARLSDTSEAPPRVLAFRGGKRARPAAVLSAMSRGYDLGSEGIAATTLREKQVVADDATAALRKAIRENRNIDRVEPLLERGADVDAKADNMSFLEYAIDNRNSKVALALLQRGAGKDALAKALRYAVQSELPTVAREILKTGEVVPDVGVLYEAILGNKPATVGMLLRHGADPTAKYRGATVFSALFKYFNYCDDKRIENKKKILALLLKDEKQEAVFQKNIGRYIAQIRKNADTYEMPCAQKLINHLEAMKVVQCRP